MDEMPGMIRPDLQALPGTVDADHPIGAFPAECCVVQRIIFS